MEYCMLLWPHANARYQNETLKLAQSELRLILDFAGVTAELSVYPMPGLPALLLRTQDALPEHVLASVRMHSLLYALFEKQGDDALKLVAGRAEAFVGSDLPGILKYKGKTNELFLQLLLNAARFSGSFALKPQERIELLDPMCGRGTSLFVAANMGWNATGSDVDRNDLSEAENFLKRYFEYHKMKHTREKTSRTADGKAVPMTVFTFADTPEHFRAGRTEQLSLACADALKVRSAFGRDRFHVIAADLPYGVQHGGVGDTPGKLLERALPEWRQALKKGGCAAVSFNAKTLKREAVLESMEKAGLVPLTGGAYEGFSHWVEQAITRDIAVGRKEKN